MPAPKKPAETAAPEPKPGVDVGDHIYVHHRGSPCTGRVLSHGAHGVTVHIDGQQHRVKWDKVLGHKRRAVQRYNIVDEGEDGMIVADAAGRRRYIATPNDAKEDPMVAKAQRPVLLFTKSDPPATPRAGLTKKQLTDKAGHQTTRWVRVDRGGPPAQRGQHVGFENGEHRGHGEVVASGQHGVTVRDRAGGEHRLMHEKVTHHWGGDGAPDMSPHDAKAGVETPNYAPRLEGESDKQYAKRVVDKTDAPNSLPEDHSRYFNVDGSTHVPLDRLHSTKTAEENEQGGDNGPKRMLAAYHGHLGKRDPIKVMPHAEKDGHFEVVDGNGTLTSAQRLGWKGLPAKIVGRDQGLQERAAETAKDLFKSFGAVERLPLRAAQPHSTWEPISAAAPEALQQFTEILGKVGQAMGLRTGKKPKALTPEEWGSADGHLFIGSLKGEVRAREKADADYDGDYSKLCDIVRGTIAVATLDEARQALEHIKASGLELAQRPKNRLAEPTETGYRDLLMVVKLPGGMMAELQVSLKSMQQAKSGDGHKEYDVTRGLQAKYGESEPTEQWSSEDHTEFYRALKAQKDIYGAAWRKAIGGAPAKDAEKFGENVTPGLTKSLHTPHIMLVLKGV